MEIWWAGLLDRMSSGWTFLQWPRKDCAPKHEDPALLWRQMMGFPWRVAGSLDVDKDRSCESQWRKVKWNGDTMRFVTKSKGTKRDEEEVGQKVKSDDG